MFTIWKLNGYFYYIFQTIFSEQIYAILEQRKLDTSTYIIQVLISGEIKSVHLRQVRNKVMLYDFPSRTSNQSLTKYKQLATCLPLALHTHSPTYHSVSCLITLTYLLTHHPVPNSTHVFTTRH